MSIRSLLSLILGLAVIALGVWLLVAFWKDFVGILKGIIGLIVIFFGLGITTISYFVFRTSCNKKIEIREE